MYKEAKKLLALSLTLTVLFAMVGFTHPVFAESITTSGIVKTGRVTRISGQDRYITAITAATTMEGTKSGNVVLVSGDSYADAISATTLARHLNAPVLLTEGGRDKLNVNTKTALGTLKTKTVYIVGGTGVITPKVRTELQSSGYTLVQLGGVNRYDTNVKVANELVTLGVTTTNVMMVGGENYPDALSVAPVAANKDQILLLANTSTTNSKPAIDFVNNHKSTVLVIGTTNMISSSVKSSIVGTSTSWIDGGNTRYDTNKIILDTFFTYDLDFNKIYIASGENFPDALVAAPLAGCYASPLLLVNTKTRASTFEASKNFVLNYLKENAFDTIYSTTQINVVGGNGAVSEDFINAINITLPENR